jgi:hypothetical protein
MEGRKPMFLYSYLGRRLLNLPAPQSTSRVSAPPTSAYLNEESHVKVLDPAPLAEAVAPSVQVEAKKSGLLEVVALTAIGLSVWYYAK